MHAVFKLQPKQSTEGCFFYATGNYSAMFQYHKKALRAGFFFTGKNAIMSITQFIKI